jgi:hypothetical protein
MKYRMVCAAFAALLVVHPAAAQDYVPDVRELPVDISEDELSRRFTSALGGEEAWSRLETTITKGTVEVRGVRGSGWVETYEKAPNLTFMRTVLPGGIEVTQGCDGRTAWEGDAHGANVLDGGELREALDDCAFLALVDLKRTYGKLKIVGKSSQDGQEFYLVEALRSDGLSDTLSIDAKTYLLNLVITPRHIEGEIVPMALLFGDYRTVGGVMMPYLMRMKIGDMLMTTKVTSIALNEPVDDAKFAMPVPQIAELKR